ncbi:LPS translocon maturation chaperone LptM [Alteromonas flava]|uniref:LPS translocon maturation chaperone LptM n=1 Tax=Alteromonas flava TaxID=2048003 RepID=UPI0013DB28BA|nr:lipoprotein [Alteromonas flava]
MKTKKHFVLIFALVAWTLAAAGCGYRGALYLPEPTQSNQQSAPEETPETEVKEQP